MADPLIAPTVLVTAVSRFLPLLFGSAVRHAKAYRDQRQTVEDRVRHALNEAIERFIDDLCTRTVATAAERTHLRSVIRSVLDQATPDLRLDFDINAEGERLLVALKQQAAIPAIAGSDERYREAWASFIECMRAGVAADPVLGRILDAQDRADRSELIGLLHASYATLADAVTGLSGPLMRLAEAGNRPPSEAHPRWDILRTTLAANRLVQRLVTTAGQENQPWLDLIESTLAITFDNDVSSTDIGPWIAPMRPYRVLEKIDLVFANLGYSDSLSYADVALLVCMPFMVHAQRTARIRLTAAMSRDGVEHVDSEDPDFDIFLRDRPSAVERASKLREYSREQAESVDAFLRGAFVFGHAGAVDDADAEQYVAERLRNAVIEMDAGALRVAVSASRHGPTRVAQVPQSVTARVLGRQSLVHLQAVAAAACLGEHMTVEPCQLSSLLDYFGTSGAIHPEDVHRDLLEGSWSIAPETRVLTFALRCKRAATAAALEEYLSTFEGQLRQAHQSAVAPPAVAVTLNATPRPDGDMLATRGEPIRFSFSAADVRGLFAGEDLWAHPAIAFRELYQNALDACRYRECRSRHEGVAYCPTINFYEGEENGRHYVECTDNGIGMDVGVISSLFSRAGRRFTQSPAFVAEQSRWSPDNQLHENSRFGIGVLSYFLVADELELETCRLGEDAQTLGTRLHITIPSATSVFSIRELPQSMAREGQFSRSAARGLPRDGSLHAGTRIRLWIRDEIASADTYISAAELLGAVLWYTDVSVTVTDEQSTRRELWEPQQLATWLRPHARPAAGCAGEFWWATGATVKPTQSAADRLQIAAMVMQRTVGPCGTLVDGLLTNRRTGPWVINLTGVAVPSMSPDRLHLREDIREHEAGLATRALADLSGRMPRLWWDIAWTLAPHVVARIAAAEVTLVDEHGQETGERWVPITGGRPVGFDEFDRAMVACWHGGERLRRFRASDDMDHGMSKVFDQWTQRSPTPLESRLLQLRAEDPYLHVCGDRKSWIKRCIETAAELRISLRTVLDALAGVLDWFGQSDWLDREDAAIATLIAAWDRSESKPQWHGLHSLVGHGLSITEWLRARAALVGRECAAHDEEALREVSLRDAWLPDVLVRLESWAATHPHADTIYPWHFIDVLGEPHAGVWWAQVGRTARYFGRVVATCTVDFPLPDWLVESARPDQPLNLMALWVPHAPRAFDERVAFATRAVPELGGRLTAAAYWSVWESRPAEDEAPSPDSLRAIVGAAGGSAAQLVDDDDLWGLWPSMLDILGARIPETRRIVVGRLPRDRLENIAVLARRWGFEVVGSPSWGVSLSSNWVEYFVSHDRRALLRAVRDTGVEAAAISCGTVPPPFMLMGGFAAQRHARILDAAVDVGLHDDPNSVARAIAVALARGISPAELDARLRELPPELGLPPPERTSRYMSLTWGELVDGS